MKKLRNSLKNKLHSNAGESIVETLCAILVAALAVVTLIAMVTTAARMNRSVKKMESTYHTSLDKLNTKSGVDAAPGTVEVTVSGVSETYSVNVYTVDGFTIYTTP